MDPLAVSAEEAAELCGFSKNTLYEFIKNDGTFPVFAVGERKGHYIIPVDELRRWLNERGRLRVGLRTTSSPIAQIIDARRREKKRGHEDV